MINMGETKHKLYVISKSYDININNNNNNYYIPYHTLVELACSAGRGINASNTDALFYALWEKICGLRILRVDGFVLHYYGAGWKTHKIVLSELLEDKDAQCYAWAELMKEAGALLGLSLEKKEIGSDFDSAASPYDDYRGFLQKVNEAQGGCLTLYVGGQQKGFGKHYVIEYDNRIYDPSIGESADSFSEYLHKYILAFFFSDGNLQSVDPTIIPNWQNHFSYGAPVNGN